MNISSGSTFAEISKSQLNNLEFIIPDYETQQKIAKVLSMIDDKIELNNKINENLEQQAQAIFVHCFSIVNRGDGCIGDYIKPKRGRNLLSKFTIRGDVPVIAGGLMPAGYHNLSNTLAPVITISASGANAGYINLWHVPVWSSDSSYIDINVTPYVYFWFVLLKRRQQEIFDSQVGSAQSHTYPKHIEALSLKKLDESLVSQYNNVVTPLFKCIGKNIKENLYLSQLRDTLLPRDIHFSKASNSSMEPLTRNLAKRAIVFSGFSKDFVTTMERLLKAASQCLCRPLLRSIGGV